MRGFDVQTCLREQLLPLLFRAEHQLVVFLSESREDRQVLEDRDGRRSALRVSAALSEDHLLSGGEPVREAAQQFALGSVVPVMQDVDRQHEIVLCGGQVPDVAFDILDGEVTAERCLCVAQLVPIDVDASDLQARARQGQPGSQLIG